MPYTVRDVARLSGVSVRTLHFYDGIGLLKPAAVGDNGYRYYGEAELLRLQQILSYRELGLPLNEIRTLMAEPDVDRLATLQRHRDAMTERVGRLQTLIETLDRTIAHVKGDHDMTADELYHGFAPADQAAYEDELIERYGDGARSHLAESKRRMQGWSKADFATVKADLDAMNQALTSALAAGLPTDASEVQDLIQQHYDWVCRFWTPDRDAYTGLGQLYLDHPDFQAVYAAYHPELAGYLAKAMAQYAEARLP